MSKDKKATYYDTGGMETIEIIKAKLTAKQFKGFLLGNIIKYSCRLNSKGTPDRDSEKIVTYSSWLKEVAKDKRFITESGEELAIMLDDNKCFRDFKESLLYGKMAKKNIERIK